MRSQASGDGTGGNGIINAAPIVDFDLNRNRFAGHINAIAITNATGDGFVTDNEFIGTSGVSERGLLITNNVAGTLDLEVSGNTAEDHDESGFSLNANVNAAAIINADVSGNTANQNGNGFEFLVGGGEINLDFNDNTASENTSDAENAGGVTATVTAGELNVDLLEQHAHRQRRQRRIVRATSGVGSTVVVRDFFGNTITGNGVGNTTTNLANGVRLVADGVTYC
jgi:hypothetical protein